MNEHVPPNKWAEYQSFGSVLSDAMKLRDLKTDKSLADAATKTKDGALNERVRRNISNWRKGIGPNERSLDDVEKVRKALKSLMIRQMNFVQLGTDA